MSGNTRLCELEIDATARIGWPTPLHTSALVVVPSSLEVLQPCVIFAYPGGTHSKEYYDMHVPGFEGYSMAEYFAQRGYIFVACDPLGVGASSDPGAGEEVTRRVFVDGNHATVVGVMELLHRGKLIDGLAAQPAAITLGLGTSMGAMLLIEQQAVHRSFDGITVMGYSAMQTQLRVPPAGWSPPSAYSDHPNRDLFYTLYWDDTPPAIIAADQALSVVPPVAAVREGGGYKAAMDRGCVADAAAAIDVPILIALGERDTCPDPHTEVTAYSKATDVALFVVPRAGHAPSVANTRGLLWSRIDSWAQWTLRRAQPALSRLLAPTLD
jgi:pimeloyl-ACP methyl ester carboxylesterase